MAAQIAEHVLVAIGGGASIPRVMALLCRRSKYSPVATQIAAATAIVNTQPPASTIPSALNPMIRPNIILFFNCPFWVEGDLDFVLESSSMSDLSCTCNETIPHLMSSSGMGTHQYQGSFRKPKPKQKFRGTRAVRWNNLRQEYVSKYELKSYCQFCIRIVYTHTFYKEIKWTLRFLLLVTKSQTINIVTRK